jgi:hypothetical protein
LSLKPVATVSSGLTSKLVTVVFSSLALKPMTIVSPILASKPVVGFLVEHQNQGGGQFLDLGLKTDNYDFVYLGFKITATVSWFWHQNQACFSLSIASQRQQREVGAGHTSRSSGLLYVEANRAKVSKSGRKTGGGATAGGARGTITEVTSESS